MSKKSETKIEKGQKHSEGAKLITPPETQYFDIGTYPNLFQGFLKRTFTDRYGNKRFVVDIKTDDIGLCVLPAHVGLSRVLEGIDERTYGKIFLEFLYAGRTGPAGATGKPTHNWSVAELI